MARVVRMVAFPCWGACQIWCCPHAWCVVCVMCVVCEVCGACGVYGCVLYASEGLSDRSLALLAQVAFLIRVFHRYAVICGELMFTVCELNEWVGEQELCPLRAERLPTGSTPDGRSVEDILASFDFEILFI